MLTCSSKNSPSGEVIRKVVQTWHLITCEYPPQLGGVSDYTYLVAEGLSAAGDEVDVWCPDVGLRRASTAVRVHKDLGRFHIRDLRRTGEALNKFTAPRRLVVQWVPHGFGYRSVNLPFCIWLWVRSKVRRDSVELMVHEPFLAFQKGAWRQNIVAVVHRVMTIILLQAADQVWISIPAWKERLLPYALGRKPGFDWLPVPSNIPIHTHPGRVADLRSRFGGGTRFLLGHFGTYGPAITKLLEPCIEAVLRRQADASVLLVGKGSEEFREKFHRRWPALAIRVESTGSVPAHQVSDYLVACDVLIQPYPDGISTRRTGAMAALSHGKPLITTSGELTEAFWCNSGAVVLTPAGDTEALVGAVLKLLADDAHRLQTGCRARQLYEAEFTVERLIGRFRRGLPKLQACDQ